MSLLRRPSAPPRLPLRPTRWNSFTLVELLVVIAIIALLASVAIGPITGAMKTAKDNAGMQTTHGLYVADFQYSIDNNAFADGQDAGAIAQELVQGNYITDPTIFFISGGNATKYTGANGVPAIQASNVSWDFMGSNPQGGGTTTTYSGLSTSDPDQLPLVWATGNTINLPPAGGNQYGTALVNTGRNPYGTDGIPVAYKSGVSKFAKVNLLTPATVTNFIDNSYSASATANYQVRKGSE